MKENDSQSAPASSHRSVLQAMDSSARLLLSSHDAVLTVDMGVEASRERVQVALVSVM